MIIKDKHISFKSGYIRFKFGLEINWMLNNWALPLCIDVSSYLAYIQIFCVTFYIEHKYRFKLWED